MSNSKSRYSLRSSVIDTGTISTRTRSSGVKIAEVDLTLPVRKRAIRVKTEPLGVVIKVEQPEVEENIETTIPEPVLQVKSEHEASTPSNASVPKVELPPSPSSSRSSSPIFLKASPRASPSLTTVSSSSSLSSTLSLSSVSSSCSSFHLSSSSPPPTRQRDDSMDSWSNLPSINNAPCGSTARVWDMQNGQLVIRELPLVQTVTETPRYEPERSVSTFNRGRPYGRPYYRKPFYKKPFYKKPYYKKPYMPYWKRNNRGGSGASRWNCRCSGESCSNCGDVTTYQSNNQPMNLHCDISINAPSTHQSSSVYIEELSDAENPSSSYKKNTKVPNAVDLPDTASLRYSLSTPIIIPVPVPVVVPQPVHYYQPNVQTAYSYMGYNVSCSTRIY